MMNGEMQEDAQQELIEKEAEELEEVAQNPTLHENFQQETAKPETA